jgi:hypothetical membrane protein
VKHPDVDGFAAIAFGGLVLIAIATIVLHFLPTGYNPLTQAVSDYAVGPYSALMMSGFFAGGIGNMSLAVALGKNQTFSEKYRAGAVLVFLAGAALFVLGFFPTDIEGSSMMTTHGLVHSIISLVVFIAWPVGMLLVSYTLGRGQFLASVLALVIAGTFFALNAGLALRVGWTGGAHFHCSTTRLGALRIISNLEEYPASIIEKLT